MSYKLYTDKQEVFECKIQLEGASLTKATSRILVETLDLKLLFVFPSARLTKLATVIGALIYSSLIFIVPFLVKIFA